MARPITDRAALDMNLATLTDLAEKAQAAANATGPNSADGKPFANLAAALWDIIELRDEALARVEATPDAAEYQRIEAIPRHSIEKPTA